MLRNVELMSRILTYTRTFLTKYYSFPAISVSQTIIFFFFYKEIKIIYISQIMLAQVKEPLLQKNCIFSTFYHMKLKSISYFLCEWETPEHKANLIRPTLILTMLGNHFLCLKSRDSKKISSNHMHRLRKLFSRLF